MWERYGFYVVQTLLVLYLINHFNWDDSRTFPLIGAFTALTYLSPLIGGWIADKLLGQKRSILAGAIILMASYLAMSYWTSELGLVYSLAGIAVGTGLLKPNISSLLGNAYKDDSPNRERGFTIFYMGITTGIILGTTLPSYIQSEYGWSKAFFSAAIGMLLAVFVFLFGIQYYRTKDYSPYHHRYKDIAYAFFILLALFYGSFYILYHAALANLLFTGIGVFSLFYLTFAIYRESGQQARQTLVIGLLCLISVMFWSFYFQMFSSIMVFLSRVTRPSLFGIPFPPPYFVAVQSIGMILFGIFLGRKHSQTDLNKRTIQAGNKFVLSMVFMTLAYLLLTLVCTFETGLILLTPLFFIPSYLMISMSELLLSPVGLASITLLSSYDKVSTMMGIFFVSLGMGGFLSGKIAGITAIPKEELDSLSLTQIKADYAISFRYMLYIIIAATIISFLINIIIRYLMTRPIDETL